MKNIVLLLFIFISTTSLCQDSTEYKMLFDGEKIKLNTFYVELAPSTAWENLADAFGQSFSIEAGMHLNRKFGIGVYSANSKNSNQIEVPQPGTPQYDDWINAGVALDQLPPGTTVAFINFKHTGLNLSYMFRTEKVIFYRANFKFGSGKLDITQSKKSFIDVFNTPIYRAKVFNLNPEIGIGVNIRPWWRIVSDIGYRFVTDSSDEVSNPASLQGITLKLGFAFGAFNK